MPAQHAPVVIPADRREWRPQTLSRATGKPTIVDPLVEPLWSGVRVLVHYRGSEQEDQWGTIEVIDMYGDDALEAAPIALDFLRRSILASEAVIDGVITTQATTGGEGLSVVVTGRSNPMSQLFVGQPRQAISFEPPRNREPGMPGFVALDLLSIDDQPLFDVPLLERKRVLEGAIAQSDLVRISPVVRPPLRQWFASWQSAGFKGLMIKSSNSRYEPGGETREWATVLRMPSN
jgi:ATP dependent DNA ligase-like protein